MVVGRSNYKNTNEAFPLDSKTLNKIALRSIFANTSETGETGNSIGWAWALEPGLKKIHTDKDDYSLSMGHNLEYVDSGFFLNTFAMGVTLALEAQKADLDTIRSVRLTSAAIAKGLGNTLFYGLIIPFLASGCAILGNEGNILGTIIFAIVGILLTFFIRFFMLKYGYKHATKACETLLKNKDALTKACQMSGVIMIGFLLVYLSQNISLDIVADLSLVTSSSNIEITDSLNSILPGFLMIITFLCSYHFLNKKNWSITKCILLVFVISIVGTFLGIWAGNYNPPINWPWIS